MKKFLTVKEAADYLGIEEIELQERADNGKVPSYRIGGVYTRFRADDLDSFRRKIPRRLVKKGTPGTFDNIKDFFYFNDFYLFSFIAILVILYFIFR
ncbi:MAG: helix-turn-helix domain-containing protein [Candidatus Omnitrophica bacterium]|nr:helix-turn-helix domain-containing protein [Candidatus Omnitrophota bacterium]MBU4457536.1 helix-turn-helix domain-containing protein [Candidatus Omnitrophota bacterium]